MYVTPLHLSVNRYVKMSPQLIATKELGERSCLDFGARGIWRPLEKTLCDVRIFHPGADSYRNRQLKDVYKQHEQEKKRKYLDHVLNVEKCSFTPLVYSTHGGCGSEAEQFQKRIATLLVSKRDIPYSDAMSYVRRRLRFSILRTTLIAIRGFRGTHPKKPSPQDEIDLNLLPKASRYEHLI